MNRKFLLVGLIIVIPFIVLLIVNIHRDPHNIKSPMIGKPAPSFTLKDVTTGETVSLASLRGTPVVVNFWATWCVPCFQEHPVLQSTARELGGRVRFVGVVYDDDETKIRQFLAQNGTAYPTLVDDGGKTAIAYGVYGVPETFFINPQGVIVDKYAGPLSPDAIYGYLQKAGGAL
jgi:cytochrome c biogenesis protein CcmG/thiol:disulfide interchange protein DsbE